MTTNRADLIHAMRMQALADAALRRLDKIADAMMVQDVSPAVFDQAAERAAAYREEAREAWDRVDGRRPHPVEETADDAG